MRALSYAFLAVSWALCAGCLGAPKAEDWLAVGFRTPEQTFRTFQTGLRAGLPDLEYRCLGGGFKRRASLSQLAYLEFRHELFDSRPWLKLAATAKVREIQELSDGHVRLVAEVDTWLHDTTFTIDLVREDFWEVWVGDKRVDDDYARWSRLAREKGGKLVLTVPLPDGLAPAEIGTVRVGREWKIDGFPLSPEPGQAEPGQAQPGQAQP